MAGWQLVSRAAVFRHMTSLVAGNVTCRTRKFKTAKDWKDGAQIIGLVVHIIQTQIYCRKTTIHKLFISLHFLKYSPCQKILHIKIVHLK